MRFRRTISSREKKNLVMTQTHHQQDLTEKYSPKKPRRGAEEVPTGEKTKKRKR